MMMFYGLYRGVVVDNNDPDKRGRLKVRVPAVTGDSVTGWAWPCATSGPSETPNNGAGVWVQYEGGDPDYPVWVGVFAPQLASSGGGGFDPNETPTIIGLNATAGSGTPSSPISGPEGAVAVGELSEADAEWAISLGASTASGIHDIAIGWHASSSQFEDNTATDNIAIGRQANAGTTVIGSSSNVALGPFAQANAGANATAVGANSDASYNNATAIGTAALVQAAHGTAVGDDAAVRGDSGTAVGRDAGAGLSGTAVGRVAGALANYSTAVGYAANASSHAYSSALGTGATTTKEHQVMLGSTDEFVEIPGNGSANGLVLTDTTTGARYIVQITAGSLVLNAAP